MSFAFRRDDILKSEYVAHRLRKHLNDQGHQAHVEKSGDEHRVWVQHPKYDDTVAYVHPDDIGGHQGGYKPQWIKKAV